MMISCAAALILTALCAVAQGADLISSNAIKLNESSDFTLRAKVSEVLTGSRFALDLAGRRSLVELGDVEAARLDQVFGQEAAAFARERLLGKTAWFYVGRIEGDQAIARVELSTGENLGLEMVRAGLAWVKPDCRDSLYLAAQETAKAGRIGLWSRSNPTPPWAGVSKAVSQTAKPPGTTPIGGYVVLAVIGFLAWYCYKVSRQVGRRLASATDSPPTDKPKRSEKPLTRLVKTYISKKFGKDNLTKTEDQ